MDFGLLWRGCSVIQLSWCIQLGVDVRSRVPTLTTAWRYSCVGIGETALWSRHLSNDTQSSLMIHLAVLWNTQLCIETCSCVTARPAVQRGVTWGTMSHTYVPRYIHLWRVSYICGALHTSVARYIHLCRVCGCVRWCVCVCVCGYHCSDSRTLLTYYWLLVTFYISINKSPFLLVCVYVYVCVCLCVCTRVCVCVSVRVREWGHQLALRSHNKWYHPAATRFVRGRNV